MSAMPSLSAPDEVLPGRPESLKTPVDSEADQVASSWLQVQDPHILLRNLVIRLSQKQVHEIPVGILILRIICTGAKLPGPFHMYNPRQNNC